MKLGSPDKEEMYKGQGEGLEVIRLPAGWSGTSQRWQQIGCRAPGGCRSPPTPVPSALLRGKEAALCAGKDNQRAAQELLKHHLLLPCPGGVQPHFVGGDSVDMNLSKLGDGEGGGAWRAVVRGVAKIPTRLSE